MRKYTSELLDVNGQAICFLENAHNIVMQGFRLNQANTPAFVLPVADLKAVNLSLARKFKIYREGQLLYSGKIKERSTDDSKGIISVKGLTNEAELRRMITPENWTHLNDRDLADAVRYLLKNWEIYKKNTGDDFAGYVVAETSNVDTTTDPGIIFLKRNAGQYNHEGTMINYDQFVAHGNITLEFNLSTDVTEVERIRWKQVVGEAKDDNDKVQGTYITFQYRHSINAGSSWSAWSAEFGQNAVSDYPENDGFPVPIQGLLATNDNRLQIKMHLYTENTTVTAYDWDDLNPATDRNTLGITPELHGIEIICRKPGYVTEGSIPATTGVTVENFNVSRDHHRNVIKQLCDEYDYEFRVNDDLTLDLVQEFGTVHTTPFIAGQNCKITNLGDEFDVKNVLHCFGAGEGPNQLYVVVRDETSVQQYGEHPGIFEDTTIDNIANLTTAGNNELQGQPSQKFDIEIPYGSDLPFVQLGDTITILIPKKKIETTGRVKEWSGGETGKGEIIQVSLDSHQANLMDYIIKPKKLQQKFAGVQPPTQVRASGGYGYVQASWSGNADYYLVQHTETPGDDNSWRNTGGKVFEKKYILTQLATSTKIYVRVASVKDGRMSLWSLVVSATTTQIPPNDVQRPTPSVPQNLAVASTITQPASGVVIISNMLTWTAPNAAEKITDVNIERKELPGGAVNPVLCPNENGPYYDTDGLKPSAGYEYRIRFVNEWNQKSDWTAWIAVTTPSAVNAPAKPTGVVATPYFSTIALRCNPNSDIGLAGYEWRYSTGTDPNAATVLAGTANTNTYNGTYGQAMNFWVRAYTIVNNIKHYSAWSDMVTATPGKVGKDDMAIFENGVLTPEVITNVLSANIINVGGAYTLEPDGIKDSTGYPIIDPNGFNGKIIASGVIKSDDPACYYVTLSDYTLPNNRKLVCVVTPYDFSFGTSPTSKQLKAIGSFDFPWFHVFCSGTFYVNGSSVTGLVYDGSAGNTNIQVQIQHETLITYWYSDNSEETKKNYISAYYQIMEYKA